MKTKRQKPTVQRTLVPDMPIEGMLRYDRRYLSTWFTKLAEANICTLRDLWDYTPEELFAKAPTNKSNQERFMYYVNNGMIDLRDQVRTTAPE